MKFAPLLLLAAIAAAAADPKIAGGPYVVNVTQRSATVVWLVESGETTIRPANGPARTSPAFRVEKTMLSGLQPNTRYEYAVPGGDAGKGSFKTAPGSGPTPFTFVAYGDNRTRHDVHKRVIETLISKGIPDFILQTGDLISDGLDGALWPIFFDIEKQLLNKAAFFPALGNHERNTPSFYEYFQTPKGYYSFNWGNAHFAVLNTDVGNVSPLASERAAYWNEQVRWLEEDLKANQTADFRFVAGHHPPFTAVKSRQGNNSHMIALTPLLEKYRVSAGIFGHDHNYQHYLKNGIHYIGTGGGGAPLYDVDLPPAGITQKVVSIENFVTFQVDGKSAKVKTISIDGSVIDEFNIAASEAPANPQP